MFKHARTPAEAFTMQQLFKQHCVEPDLVPLRLGSRQGELQSKRSYSNSVGNSVLYNMPPQEMIKLASKYGIPVPVASLGAAQSYIDNQLFVYSDYVTSFNNASPATRLRYQLEGVLQPFEPTMKAWIENLTSQQRKDIMKTYSTFPLGGDRMDVDDNNGIPAAQPAQAAQPVQAAI
jgi:hypothetical protein